MLKNLSENDTNEKNIFSIFFIVFSTISLFYASSIRFRNSFSISFHESMMQIEKFEIIFFTFHMTSKLWCKKIEIFRMNYVMHREIMNLLKISTIEMQKKKNRIKIDRNFEKKRHSKFVFEIEHFKKTNSTSHVFIQNISKNVVDDHSQTVFYDRKTQKKLSTSTNRTNDVTILI